jgi:flagellar FliL protein
LFGTINGAGAESELRFCAGSPDAALGMYYSVGNTSHEIDREDLLMLSGTKWLSACTVSSIMATSTPVGDTASTILSTDPSGPIRLSMASVLIAMLIGAAIASLGFCGLLYYFAHSGRLSMRGSAVMKAPPPVETATRLMVLEPLLVNLADEGGSSYLRLSLTLQLASAVTNKSSSTNASGGSADETAAVRDTALTVLGRQTVESLLAPKGKEYLKAELKKALAEHNADLKVKQIFFTDFLVQR